MAIKGQAYIKTAWAFQERPVSSAKLNLWDDRIEAALERVCYLLNLAWGGGDGVIRGAAESDLQVIPSATPGMSVMVQPGWAFISHLPYHLDVSVQTPAVPEPLTGVRLDLVQARLGTWDVSVKTGTESASPSAPTPDTDCIPLAHLFLRLGMSAINQTDDGTNGYIIDKREFV